MSQNDGRVEEYEERSGMRLDVFEHFRQNFLRERIEEINDGRLARQHVGARVDAFERDILGSALARGKGLEVRDGRPKPGSGGARCTPSGPASTTASAASAATRSSNAVACTGSNARAPAARASSASGTIMRHRLLLSPNI